MIPSFDAAGLLPPGVHVASLPEIAARFGVQSELRRVQMESVQWMVELALRAGVRRIVLNGSFVTDVPEPNDVDCALLVGPGFPRDRGAEAELRAGLPFMDIALVGIEQFNMLIEEFFVTDRYENPKGMIEVIL